VKSEVDKVRNSSCESRVEETVDNKTNAAAKSSVPMQTGQNVNTAVTPAHTEAAQVLCDWLR